MDRWIDGWYMEGNMNVQPIHMDGWKEGNVLFNDREQDLAPW